MGRFDAVEEVEERAGFFKTPGHLYVVEFLSAEEIETHKYKRANCYRWKVLATDDPMCAPGTEKVMIDGCVEHQKRAYWAERMMHYEKVFARTNDKDRRTNGSEFEELFDNNWEEYAGTVVQINTKPSRTGEFTNTYVDVLSPAGQALLDGAAAPTGGGTMPEPASRKRFGG